MITTRQVFHLGVVVYYFVISHLMAENMLKQKEDELNDPMVKTMNRYSMCYLTKWTFVLQIIYFSIALAEEAILMLRGQDKLKANVTNCKNYVFTSIGAPMALVVSITFWSFWLVDRELIFPRKLDKVIPPWVNHSLHTTTSVLVLMEMYLCHHKYPKFKSALMAITCYLLMYSFCLLGTYFESGIWIYPVLGTLSWTLRVVFALGVYLLAIAFYGVGYFTNKMIWGEEPPTKKQGKKKQKRH